MRLLVINPNISESVTALIEAEARRSAEPGTGITMKTAAFGVAYIETRFEDRGANMQGDDDTEVMEVEPLEAKPILSPRQGEVLEFLKEGLTNPEIAEKLGVTERTVKAHCQEVFDRLGARNRTAAVAAAMRMGLFEDERH